MQQRIKAVRDKVLAHPFHKACGLELLAADEGKAEITIAMNEFTLNPEGALHGGVLYAFVDVACFFAAISRLEEEQHPVSIETHVSLLRAATREDQLVVRAGVDRLGRTLAAMRAEVIARRDGEERLIATGSVTKAILTGRSR